MKYQVAIILVIGLVLVQCAHNDRLSTDNLDRHRSANPVYNSLLIDGRFHSVNEPMNLSIPAKIFFSGDSGYFDGFKQISEAYGPFAMTFIEWGTYNTAWAQVHMFPDIVILIG